MPAAHLSLSLSRGLALAHIELSAAHVSRLLQRNSLSQVQLMSDQEQISTLLLKGEYDWGK